MREIKFRAWNSEEKKMYKVLNIAPSDNGNCSVQGIATTLLEVSVKAGNYPEYFDLMQYTGLKDKNGVEIYEGDIVEEDWVLGKTIYKPIEITWNQHICAFCTGSKTLQFLIRCVVIGNLYENPEVLDNN